MANLPLFKEARFYFVDQSIGDRLYLIPAYCTFNAWIIQLMIILVCFGECMTCEQMGTF